jgi:hypothetical protein
MKKESRTGQNGLFHIVPKDGASCYQSVEEKSFEFEVDVLSPVPAAGSWANEKSFGGHAHLIPKER